MLQRSCRPHYDAERGNESSVTLAEEEQKQKTLVGRLEHFTWVGANGISAMFENCSTADRFDAQAWFTLPMSTGGIALLLHPDNQPNTFPGLLVIGRTFYLLEVLLFVAVTCTISFRFARCLRLLKESLTHPSESLFFATSFLSLASIISGMHLYGLSICGPWLLTAYRILFWFYFTITFIVAIWSYYLLFSSPALKIQDMTPAWDLPIFPFMLSGTLAAIGAGHQPETHAVAMIVAGLTAQGLGMTVSLIMYVM
jgi:tellurite resistance protein TehA-like permease